MESTNRSLRVDIYENERELLLVADLPGVRPEALKLDVDQGELRIDATTAAEGPFGAQRWQRVFGVPRSVSLDDVRAELRDGVLRVTLPRDASARKRVVPIATA